jgi:ABC-2 type transport system ATP-binding protein
MISVSHVSKRFGPVTALDDVSLEIGNGERVALIGTNGSGKTTLLRAACGLIRVEGRVEIAGCDVAREPERALARVSYMPQVAPPLDAPVRELVRAFCALRGRRPDEVTRLAAELGLKLEAVAATRARDLSGGMKQKLLAALALAARAEVLICDEPTANLDARARDAFFAQVERRPADSVLVVCSHRVDEVRRFVDRVIEMRDGRVQRDVEVAEPQPERSVR